MEGFHHEQVRMMLTGQVFSIMGNVATDAQIRKIVKSADHYLYRKEIGGYRLNTDFQELKFDMGRMFGFAYGEKENGAVFSHMAVMYANALYQRGFAKEGWKALRSLSDTALDFDTSHIYPGIPEYFRSDGRGMYHYLTGAASWYLFTMITEVFGVRGVFGTFWFIQNFWQNSSMKQELLLSLLLLQENSSMLPTETQTEKIMVLIISPLRTATKQQ